MKPTALITGASGGLGQALVRQLSDEGWQLVLAGRDRSRLHALYGDEHLLVEADCSTRAGAQAILEHSIAQGKPPTALAHCVGNIRLGPLHRMKPDDFDDCLRANLLSAVYTLGAFVAQLQAAKLAGSAVLVSSAAARIGTPNHEAIAAAKGGVEGLVRAAAATYAGTGLRVNAVAPGIMDTPAAASILASQSGREAAARQYPLPGIGDPADLAALMAWLLGPQAGRVTGQVWSMDAGFSAIRPLVK